MSRPAATPTTVLGAAVQAKRAGRPMVEAGPEVGVSEMTLSRIERGTRIPSIPVARALAKWLGWSVGEVIDAAEKPAE